MQISSGKVGIIQVNMGGVKLAYGLWLLVAGKRERLSKDGNECLAERVERFGFVRIEWPES